MAKTTDVREVLLSWGWNAPDWSPTAAYTLGFRVKPARFYRTVAQRLFARGDWRPTERLRCTSQTYKRPGELRNKAKWETDDPFDLLLLGREPLPVEIEQTLRDLGPCGRRRAVNALQMFQSLTHKDRLTRQLHAYARESGVDVDAFYPRSFLITPRSGGEADQREELCETDVRLRADEGPVVFIAKEAFGCRGRRMLVDDRVDRILAHIDDQQGSCWVVQRYVHNPLLLRERKFDIRYWVAIDREQHVHGYRLFSGRIASEPYRLVDLDNTFVHLTNPFVQKRHPSYGSLVGIDGNELLLDEFVTELAHVNPRIELERDIVAPMHAIILHTIAAVSERPPSEYDGVQILGYDFMFDADLRCHLLEVNFSPSAGRSLTRLVDDFIEVAIDPLFPPTRPNAREHANAFVRIDV